MLCQICDLKKKILFEAFGKSESVQRWLAHPKIIVLEGRIRL